MRLFILGIAMLSVMACSKAPLTPGQKVEFETTAQSFAQLFNTVKLEGQSQGQVAVDSDFGSANNTIQVDPEMVDLAQGLQNGSCEFPVLGADAQRYALRIAAQGTHCPVGLSLIVDLPRAGASSAIDLNYRVNQSQFLKFNDISEFHITGSYSVTAQSSGVGLNLDAKGTVTSQKEGDIAVTISGNEQMGMSGLSGQLTADFAFPKFTAELKADLSGSTPQYTLNGETISEQQFWGYFPDHASSALTGRTPTNPSPGGSPWTNRVP